MYHNLLVEEKLDILKCLNFKQLISFQQTNIHFKALIDRYIGILAKQKFSHISLVNLNECSKLCKRIELGSSEIKLDEEILEKWQSIEDRQIPLYLCTERLKHCKHNIVIRLMGEDSFSFLLLKLPLYPKNIKEMKICRFWLEKLFLCSFENAEFNCAIFNPKLIELLFFKEEKGKNLLNINKALICYSNPNYENEALNFILNNLSINEFLKIEFDGTNNFTQYKEIILNLILNEGWKFNRILINGFKTTQRKLFFGTSFLEPMFSGAPQNSFIDSEIFDLIIRNVETSNCSNMVSNISFPYIKWFRTDLPKRAKNIEKELLKVEGRNCNFVKYEIENILNSKIKFVILHCHPLDTDYITSFHINRI
uniref:Uncharacterized protein n=1 Tax=Meloidogyne enterolobii TaxID=390850 RepID=A0A6V7XN41_MELEN|nr:unnamed protein product [Meloidogyne enterolobii]CAD2200714.1 unnamed protein product [Meloidogyne enterolobii]